MICLSFYFVNFEKITKISSLQFHCRKRCILLTLCVDPHTFASIFDYILIACIQEYIKHMYNVNRYVIEYIEINALR